MHIHTNVHNYRFQSIACYLFVPLHEEKTTERERGGGGGGGGEVSEGERGKKSKHASEKQSKRTEIGKKKIRKR